MPRQMPRNGRPSVAASFTASTRPRSRRLSIALRAAPTPGNTTRGAARTLAGSFVTSTGSPRAANASFTLVRLPAR